ncbi:OmpA family protein [Paraburkholderia fynbosensis]|uniref:Outer membrane protein A n=1 Tax=Paraburkholderia fynbosensis TaxID=1200993 RepID=A0A6J5GT70_9BURK|nr:OmpA family protein [Paraburkholderia fynbosensis]CAB3805259.1 Outer membrane protein A [Paraburkholderia fynbosensis]
MSLNVIQLVQSVLTDDIVRQLGARLGLPAETAQKALTATGPALVAGLMHKGATLEGARSLFTTILSPEVDGHIAEQLPHLLASTSGLNQLETVGRQLLERGLNRPTDQISDEVARQTGAPAHAAHAITGIVGATLFGVLKRHLLDGRGNVGQLPALLSQQLPIITPYLNDHLLGALGVGGLSAFAGSILSQLKAVSAHIDQPTPAGKPVPEMLAPIHVPADAVVREERRSHAWLWWLLAAVAAVLAFLFLRGSHGGLGGEAISATSGAQTAVAAQPASAARVASGTSATATATAASSDAAASTVEASAPSAPAAALEPTKDSQLAFTVNAAGKPTLTATVGNEAEKTQLIDELTKRLGVANVVQNVTVDPQVKPADWLAHLDGLLPLMALPGAEVKVDGTRVELSGSAADTKLGWLGKLKSLFGASYQIGTFDVAHAVADATENFRSAVKGLFAPDSTCVAADIVKVLNLQVINFSSASARVPASAVEDLNQSARGLNACAHNGKTVRLEVAGYSDNVGGAQANLQLSKKRAEAVRAYLVNAGVPADSLIAQGYGDANPVTSNDTAGGRFTNRRIEFVAQQ